MKKTAAHILDTARKLFNEQGTDATSTHDIARAAGISQGNLTYHFRKKGDLIEALYFQLMDKLNALFAQLDPTRLGLPLLYELQVHQADIQGHYRFLFLHMGSLKRQHPVIDQHFKQLLISRGQGFQQLVMGLQYLGIFRTDFPPSTWENLYQHFLVIGNFWTNAAEVLPPPDRHPHEHYAWLTLSLFYPYLTEKGMEEWEKLEQDRNKEIRE